jgi:hypothetical protein
VRRWHSPPHRPFPSYPHPFPCTITRQHRGKTSATRSGTVSWPRARSRPCGSSAPPASPWGR